MIFYGGLILLALRVERNERDDEKIENSFYSFCAPLSLIMPEDQNRERGCKIVHRRNTISDNIKLNERSGTKFLSQFNQSKLNCLA